MLHCVKCGKTDAVDAEATTEAVPRPMMRLVAVKSVEQQAGLMLNRPATCWCARKDALSMLCEHVTWKLSYAAAVA